MQAYLKRSAHPLFSIVFAYWSELFIDAVGWQDYITSVIDEWNGMGNGGTILKVANRTTRRKPRLSATFFLTLVSFDILHNSFFCLFFYYIKFFFITLCDLCWQQGRTTLLSYRQNYYLFAELETTCICLEVNPGLLEIFCQNNI
jgi:hypothetical protein